MNAPDLNMMLREMIGTPTISSANPHLDHPNLPLLEKMAGWLESSGFHTRLMPVANWPGKGNLIATLGSGRGGLVLAGHSDTVPYDQQGWKHDPFRLTEKDNRLYGLGTCDMKSFLALAIEAAKAFNPRDFKRPLMILATADEETSMCGAMALCAQDLEGARYAVIGEPTGLKPVNQHKGIFMEAIHLSGHSGHSSDPSLGNSALEGMNELITALLDWRRDLQSQHRNPAFNVPVPTLNIGHIHGGDNPNRICADCEIHLDLRPLPGMSIEELRNDLRRYAEQVARDRKLQVSFNSLFAGMDALNTSKTSAIVQAAEQLTGLSTGSVAFGTEGPYLNKLGIETLILGPGDIAQAHQPDEYLALDRIPATIELLRALIKRFCIDEEK